MSKSDQFHPYGKLELRPAWPTCSQTLFVLRACGISNWIWFRSKFNLFSTPVLLRPQPSSFLGRHRTGHGIAWSDTRINKFSIPDQYLRVSINAKPPQGPSYVGTFMGLGGLQCSRHVVYIDRNIQPDTTDRPVRTLCPLRVRVPILKVNYLRI